MAADERLGLGPASEVEFFVRLHVADDAMPCATAPGQGCPVGGVVADETQDERNHVRLRSHGLSVTIEGYSVVTSSGCDSAICARRDSVAAEGETPSSSRRAAAQR